MVSSTAATVFASLSLERSANAASMVARRGCSAGMGAGDYRCAAVLSSPLCLAWRASGLHPAADPGTLDDGAHGGLLDDVVAEPVKARIICGDRVLQRRCL